MASRNGTAKGPITWNGMRTVPGAARASRMSAEVLEQARRTIELAPKGLPVVGIDTQTALIRDPDGSWRTEGAGRVVVFTDGKEADLKVLP